MPLLPKLAPTPNDPSGEPAEPLTFDDLTDDEMLTLIEAAGLELPEDMEVVEEELDDEDLEEDEEEEETSDGEEEELEEGDDDDETEESEEDIAKREAAQLVLAADNFHEEVVELHKQVTDLGSKPSEDEDKPRVKKLLSEAEKWLAESSEAQEAAAAAATDGDADEAAVQADVCSSASEALAKMLDEMKVAKGLHGKGPGGNRAAIAKATPKRELTPIEVWAQRGGF